MTQMFIQVDAFTDAPFSGNPAAVCPLDGPADEVWMQRVAAEMNLSETAFVYPEPAGPSFRLRWFTPLTEVDLCGHATLATAHALWEEGIVDRSAPVFFETRSGRLRAAREGDWIALDFPSEPIRETISDAAELAAIGEAIGVAVATAGRNRLHLLVELADEEAVVRLSPDMRKLGSIPVRGLIVTAKSSDPSSDFVSRFFAPRVGIDEDPVTGSAHCGLGPFWASRLGRTDLVGRQVSRRGGVVRVRVGESRVELLGRAVTVMRGDILA
ncbi:putative isomerase YddE [Aquisphaera giovannonii]|uniref:Putative isomerase YddE n=1 Tax=Aquisphaera giovannonii TaxID=406548 RepID=A0A5B9W8N9_9BACT|nr:PhzF family phenazine biosynthesis protein [Aquisphaera giovannonii]QEH36988.1 putative isomerase YddE [Aquisphaera giovannonii]